MKIITLLILNFFISLEIISQTVIGDWSGFVDNQGSKLKLVFHVEEKNGLLTGTMDSPDQGAFGLKMNFVTQKGQKVVFDMSTFGIVYSGDFYHNDSLKGIFKQGGFESNLNLSRSITPINKKPNRPQEPEGFVFYKQKEISFKNEIDNVE